MCIVIFIMIIIAGFIFYKIIQRWTEILNQLWIINYEL